MGNPQGTKCGLCNKQIVVAAAAVVIIMMMDMISPRSPHFIKFLRCIFFFFINLISVIHILVFNSTFQCFRFYISSESLYEESLPFHNFL